MSFRVSFFAILLVGWALRLVLALNSVAMHWPDEQFQTLEPASKIVFGYGLMSWEWQDGFRSWITPAFFMPMLWVAKLFGATGGLEPILLTRAVMASLSVLVLFGLDRLMKRFNLAESTRLLFALLYALSAPMILWAPATLSDTVVTIFWWFGLPFALDALDRKQSFRAGLILGLPILFRPQMGVLGIGFGLVLLFSGALRGRSLRVALGGLVSVATYGLVDWFALGVPFGSLYRQLTEGLKKSEFYGVSPWWNYFPRTIENQGALWIGGVATLVAVGVCLRFLKKENRLFKKTDALLVLSPIVLYFLVHSGLKHKETRFIEIVFPVFFLLGAWGFDELSRFFLDRFPRANPFVQKNAGTALIVIALLASPSVVREILDARLYLSSVDTAGLFHRIYFEEKRTPDTPLARQCVLLIDNNWSFTRGSLGMGRQYAGVDRELKDVKPEDFRACGWIIARPESELQFLSVAAASGRSLLQITRDRSGFALYR